MNLFEKKQEITNYLDNMDGNEFEASSKSYLAGEILELIKDPENLGKHIQWSKQDKITVGKYKDFTFEIKRAGKYGRCFLSCVFIDSYLTLSNKNRDTISDSVDRLKMVAEDFICEFLEKYKD